ncbi:glycoside hydrolase family 65 protein [Paenibacillus guangzhouensis]|uniref:glycoside hydrolase family 65 protein n=1 Tax=Paenibacillus guangzhouensis TaxID=1473112 RepID=UPI00126717B4|nr:glycosyl hydrolase family 65 protein [Paenibacillus guangzhouensis]
MHQGKVIFPQEPWTITETEVNLAHNQRCETVFAVANGYIGMRGNTEEGYSGPEGYSLNGTYLNGFYDSTPIQYGEEAFGYAKNRQTMLNVADAKGISLWVDGEKFDVLQSKIIDYKRQLHMKQGVMTREIVWETRQGKQVELRIERMASFVNKHMALIRYEAKVRSAAAQMEFVSTLNGEVTNQVTMGDPRTGSGFAGQVLLTEGLRADGAIHGTAQRTKNTKFVLVSAVNHALNVEHESACHEQGQLIELRYRCEAAPDQAVVLDKYIAYFASKDYEEAELWPMAVTALTDAKAKGYNWFRERQEEILADFWQVADVSVEGDELLQQGLRFNAYHLFQSVGRDGKTNIGAKGITGEGYEGHYFWDTETYILPFFLYNRPEISRQLLKYRHSILPKAKARAAELGYEGALYAWRTIDGEETSPYYPAGSAQLHINADIAYAVKKYVEVTRDEDYLLQEGLDILVETCRFFADAGDWIEGKGFCINGVTGPDEYTAMVNNNAYTNLMVKDQFEFTVKSLRKLEQTAAWQGVQARYGLEERELEAWTTMAEQMYIHRVGQLIGQDDSFLEKAPWDFANTPREKYPLLLHFHPMVIYKYQVLKQADLVLAMYLQGHRFTREEKVVNYKYYEPLTTHDSSLSASIYAIVGAELGEIEKAYQYFMQSARMDLDDYHNNVKDGIHSASMAGSWLTIVNGFAGMRHDEEVITFNPTIPSAWTSYTFRVLFHGSLVEVSVTKEQTTYRLIEGCPVELRHGEQSFMLESERVCEISKS